MHGGWSPSTGYGTGGMKSCGQWELVQDVHPGLVLKVTVILDRAESGMQARTVDLEWKG